MKCIFYLALGFLFLCFSCNDSEHTPDVNNIEIAWNFVPFHLDQKKNTNPEKLITNTIKNHPNFGPLFFSSVVPVLEVPEAEKNEILEDVGFKNLIDTCTLIFNDIGELEKEFDRAFKYYQHYTNDSSIPNIYTFVSGFAYQNFIFQDGQRDGIGIGLDMFMGSDFPYKSVDKQNPIFSKFLTQYFDKKYLVRKSLLSWLDDKIPTGQTGQLAEIMIRNGKILFLLEKIMPSTPKDIIFECEPDEYQWCLQNEQGLWTHLLKNKLLYSNQFSKINKLVNPSPGAPGIPQEAPGGVANYIGWRIVKDFMIRSEMDIKEMMFFTDFQKIIDDSKYRPQVRK